MSLPRTPAEITETQRIAINLRLAQRLIVSAGSGKDRRSASVGLSRHLERHTCGDRVRVDFHGPDDPPIDYVGFCPALAHDPILQEAIYRAILWEDIGGLSVISARPIGHLPARLVDFYQAALSARDRLLAERDYVQSKLWG